MKISTMYLIIIISWFVLALPLNLVVFLGATREFKKEHGTIQKVAISIAQVISLVFVMLSLFYIGGR